MFILSFLFLIYTHFFDIFSNPTSFLSREVGYFPHSLQ